MFPEQFDAIFFWAFNFFIAFVASFLGSVCIDLLSPLQTRKKRVSTRVMLIKGSAFSFFVAIILSAVYDSYQMSYPLYMAIAGCAGGSGDVIYKLFVNNNFITKFIKNLFKNCKNIVLKSVGDALEEDENNKKEKDGDD